MTGLDHVGIAVADLDEAVRFYTTGLGLRLAGVEEAASDRVRVAVLPVAGARIELLAPTSPESPVARFLAGRGPGLHHIALAVPDVHAALERARSAGLRLIDEAPRRGAGGRLVAFIHPKSAGGVLIELCQSAPEARGESPFAG